MIYKIFDYINQLCCSHKEKWQSTQEIWKYKSWSSTMTCSWEYNIENEVHCNKCGKKWIEWDIK